MVTLLGLSAVFSRRFLINYPEKDKGGKENESNLDFSRGICGA